MDHGLRTEIFLLEQEEHALVKRFAHELLSGVGGTPPVEGLRATVSSQNAVLNVINSKAVLRADFVEELRFLRFGKDE